jgi:hypothetical protein
MKPVKITPKVVDSISVILTKVVEPKENKQETKNDKATS